mmetsp:Transcript_7273/g.10678  ORF Transcript_7273/g.10678 Transcript_7273/m.10678 type:complete len:102 (+) Transcript_7273:364-669(+)
MGEEIGSSTADLDRLEGEHEDVEESLENLLILPTEQSLRRVLKQIAVHFAHEEAFMTKYKFDQEAFSTQIEDQRRILNMAQKELLKTAVASSEDGCCTSSG